MKRIVDIASIALVAFGLVVAGYAWVKWIALNDEIAFRCGDLQKEDFTKCVYIVKFGDKNGRQ